MKRFPDEVLGLLVFLFLLTLLPVPLFASQWFDWGDRALTSFVLAWDGAIIAFAIPLLGCLLVVLKKRLRERSGRGTTEMGAAEGFALVMSSLSAFLCILAGVVFAIVGSYWAAIPFLALGSLPVLGSIILMFMNW